MLNIGLTGGMGCGKSTVLKYFRESGVQTIESDEIVRKLLINDEEVKLAIGTAFGSDIFDAEGNIDRGALGRMVFSDSEKLRLLESILHPRVREKWLKACSQNQEILVVEIPLLFEKQLETYFDQTMCVACAESTQWKRLQSRGYETNQIQQRLSHQMALKEKIERADILLYNNGTEAHLKEQVALILKQINKIHSGST